MTADYSGRTGAALFTLVDFGSRSRWPAVGDTGEAMYFGPRGRFPYDAQWEVTAIRVAPGTGRPAQSTSGAAPGPGGGGGRVQ